MTKERTATGADSVTDPLVTETYREIATERTPASINEALLRQANVQAGGTYSRSLLWLRPMAWAATIGLCLAIVVELSSVPQPAATDFEQRSLEPGSNASADQQEEAPLRDDKNAHETGPQPGGDTSATLQDDAPAPASRRREYQPGSQSDGRVKRVEQREQDTANPVTSPAVPETQREKRDSATTVDVDAFHVTDAPILDEAADMARMREGPNREDESSRVESRKVESAAIAGQAVNADEMSRAAASPCDAETRSEPESWLECIDELVDAGRIAEADEERQALADTFPNFDIP